jgi:preprotein translocase subunit SecE
MLLLILIRLFLFLPYFPTYVKIFIMRSLIAFLKDVRMEMNNVSWPDKIETIRLTGVVIGVSLIVAIFIGILDFLFTNLITLVLK